MPLVQPRRTGGWMDARAAAAGAGRPSLRRGWPGELPPEAQLPARQPVAPGTRPVRGYATRASMGLSSAATGAPANADGRASVFGIL